jgi:ATP-dependent RNA helicase SUPV3L1/SUV3
MDKRPPLPPKPAPVEVVEAVAAETQPVEASAETTAETVAEAPTETAAEPPTETPAEEVAADLPISGDPAPSASLLPNVTPVAEAPAAVAAPVEAAAEPAAEAPATEAPAEQAEAASAPEIAAEPVASEAAPTEAAAIEAPADAEAKPDATVEPVMVEVWRPGGRSEERRPHHDRNRQRHHGRPAEGAPAAAPGEGGEGAPREQRHRRGRRNNEFRKPREGAPADAAATPVAAAEGAPATEVRQDRPPRERFENKGRDGDRRDKFDRNKGGGDRSKGGDRNKGGGRDKGERGGRDFGGRDKGGRDKGGPSHRQWATSAAPRERDRPVDPNSPFAKLAALKEQLAGNRKE